MVEVVAYDPGWVDRFARLRSIYTAALVAAARPFVAIEHVGSTAVPGLAAKPIIDIDIIVEPAHVRGASAVIETLGFRPLGELGIPLRWAFKEPPTLAGTNTYVIVNGSLALKNHLSLRDVLCRNRELRDEYAAVKLDAGRAASDIFEYGHAKTGIIQKILAVAGLSGDELVRIANSQVPGPEVPR